MAIKFPWSKKTEKKVEEKTEEKDLYDKVDDVIQKPEMTDYVSDSMAEYKDVETQVKGTNPTSTRINIDEALDDYIEASKKRFSGSLTKSKEEEYGIELEQAASTIHSYLQSNDAEALMEKYRSEDYTKYSIIDLERYLIEEPDDFIKKACRNELYSDRVMNQMYKQGIDIYEVNKRVFKGVPTPDKGEWLVTRLMQQNAIEKAYYTSDAKKKEALERAQMGWTSSQTGLPAIDVEKAVKEVVSEDFDRGYWVQTELDILTLPLEQKQALRTFRDQNQKEGIYFEPGTLESQYSNSTGKSFESGAKK